MSPIPFIYLKIAALILVSAASVCDFRSRKIPNKLTFPASALGIVAQSIYFASWSSGRDFALYAFVGAAFAVSGWFVGVFVMSVCKFFLRQLGHGDTKLVAAVGTFLGPWLLLIAIFYYFMCFGIYSVSKMALAVPWNELVVSSAMKKAGVTPPVQALEKLNKVRKELIPVAPFIALGTLCAVLFQDVTLSFLGFK